MRRRLARLTREAHLWLLPYLRDRWRRRNEAPPRRLWVAVADHYEPLWAKAGEGAARERVALWRRRLPEIAARHHDSVGHPPQYTFFYPQEEYRPWLLAPLAEMTRQSIGDVEVHIHHDGEGERDFVDRMSRFLTELKGAHGLLRRHEGRTVFGFIHGNWALDNSLPDGRWCGLNNEISLLRDLGCYADFTLPSAPSPAQAGPVNVVYRATDDPRRPRSHETGTQVVPGTGAVGDLTIVPGPLGVSLRGRRPWRPRLETGEIAWNYGASLERAARWLRLAPRVGPADAFLKLFTHGAQERNSSVLLGDGLDRLFETLSEACETRGVALRYVTTWQMWLEIESLRRGCSDGDSPVPEGSTGRA
jgi:hypothetical protein